MTDTPLWRHRTPETTLLARFRQRLAALDARVGTDYASLHDFSIDHSAHFWRAIWQDAEIVGEQGAIAISGEGMHDTRFFPDAEVNFAENLLRPRTDSVDAAEVIVGLDEAGTRDALSRSELVHAVAGAMGTLREAGVGPGTPVAAIAPNRVDTLVLMLATTALGGVWSSCSPDFGVQAALDRFQQVEPRVLIGCDGYQFGGKRFVVLDRLAEIASSLPTLRTTLVLADQAALPDVAAIPQAQIFQRSARPASIEFHRGAFNAPLYIMFSSGTTGRPKAIVHAVGGALLQHPKEHRLHCDTQPGDRMLFFTTCGWMMWNWLVSALMSDVTVVLYDGAPTWPGPETLFTLAARERLTHLGLSPGVLSALAQSGARPKDTLNLETLRCLLSTGSPLPPQSFEYVYEAIADDLHLASITGGTDLLGCFALGVPELPVRSGEIQAAALGMALEFLDANARPVRGARGELACTHPFPTQPLGLLGDPDGKRFRATYFEPWPDIWRHGDYGEFVTHADGTPDGVVIHGRSDAVLNRGGVRIGTAEIYRQFEDMPEIVDGLAVAREVEGRSEIVLFLQLAEPALLDDALIARLRARIRQGASPRHVPDRIGAVPELPRTRSGKLVELAVREVIHNRAVANVGALANPEALEHFRDHPVLRD